MDFLEAVEARARILANGGTEEDVKLPKSTYELQREQAQQEKDLIARQVKKLDEQQEQVNAKKLKREKRKEQNRLQKARIAKEFDLNKEAGRSFIGL